MTKKLLFALAVLAALTSNAMAEEKTISVRANRGDSCAYYKGTFDPEGYMGPQREARPWSVCTVTSNGEAQCLVKDHGLTSLPDVLTFTGQFGGNGRVIAIQASHNDLNMRILCNERDGCVQFQLWNTNNFLGYACDISDYVPPKKPAPKAPPLLRKPDKSNEPVEKPSTFSL